MKNIWVLILVLTSCLSNPTEKNNNENSNLDGSNENSNLPNVVYTQKQIDSINDTKISQLLNKRLFYHAWKTTENSFPGDEQDRGLNNLVVRTNPTEDESDIIMKLNKNHSFSITFKPIYCQEHVTIKGTWKWNENSIIELNKNVIASTKVICMDFPGADPLDEYICV